MARGTTVLLLVAFLMGLSGSANSAPMPIGVLLNALDSKNVRQGAQFYLRGVEEGISVANIAGGGGLYCPPQKLALKIEQIEAVLRLFVKETNEPSEVSMRRRRGLRRLD
ncbi:MAG: hypothetical protein ISR50_07290 [Alphaproteobacteria bacterium]|nr:hypothetical protein [Alphaproteobacteria bacterium]